MYTCHATDNDYPDGVSRQRIKSNYPRTSIPKKPKKKLKVIDKQSLSCLVFSERRLDDCAGGRIV